LREPRFHQLGHPRIATWVVLYVLRAAIPVCVPRRMPRCVLCQQQIYNKLRLIGMRAGCRRSQDGHALKARSIIRSSCRCVHPLGLARKRAALSCYRAHLQLVLCMAPTWLAKKASHHLSVQATLVGRIRLRRHVICTVTCATRRNGQRLVAAATGGGTQHVHAAGSQGAGQRLPAAVQACTACLLACLVFSTLDPRGRSSPQRPGVWGGVGGHACLITPPMAAQDHQHMSAVCQGPARANAGQGPSQSLTHPHPAPAPQDIPKIAPAGAPDSDVRFVPRRTPSPAIT
jgi:hypothetical protein